MEIGIAVAFACGAQTEGLEHQEGAVTEGTVVEWQKGKLASTPGLMQRPDQSTFLVSAFPVSGKPRSCFSQSS